MSSARQNDDRPRSDLTPEELAVRAQGGSFICFSELVTRFEVRLFNFLLRRVGTAADAEDLTQETFIRAWKNIHRYTPKWRFSTWLFTIGSRLASSHMRSAARTRAGVLYEVEARRTPDPSGAMHRAEQRGRLWALAQRTLSADQNTALWLRYVDGLSIQEIAYILGKSQVGIRVSLFRARETLAKHLQADGDIPVCPASPVTAEPAGLAAGGTR
ncbi:MAG: sigma-70 family RNA polymerase sigma factor [Phycisphaerales bacterium]|nr:sigma-70 family RNA polymerase sigma factor [Phycisphaerales bacterium]